MIKNDKNIEFNRYELGAKKILKKIFKIDNDPRLGSIQTPIIHRPPYYEYEKNIKTYINNNCNVLELAAGTGFHTKALLDTGAKIDATDISPSCLKILEKTFSKYKNFKTTIADMEKLPFDDNSYDVICCAGSLSYGNTLIVQSEINRLLKPKGIFICVDSLNNNFIYKTYRYIAFIRGRRSFSTISNMPTLEKIEDYKNIFNLKQIYFYGSLLWIASLLKFCFHEDLILKLIKKSDNLFKIKKSSYKFVMVLESKKL